MSEHCNYSALGIRCHLVVGHLGFHQLDGVRHAIAEIPPSAYDQLFTAHAELGQEAAALMSRKNHDYAGESDPYRNFRTFGTLGVLVRLSDKLSRLRSFEENGTFAVADEKLRDTVLDAINYLVIYYQMKQETK